MCPLIHGEIHGWRLGGSGGRRVRGMVDQGIEDSLSGRCACTSHDVPRAPSVHTYSMPHMHMCGAAAVRDAYMRADTAGVQYQCTSHTLFMYMYSHSSCVHIHDVAYAPIARSATSMSPSTPPRATSPHARRPASSASTDVADSSTAHAICFYSFLLYPTLP